MTLHPYFQLQVGDLPLTTVPPNFVQSLTYKSSLGGLGKLDFQVVDPTFQEIEELLIGSDTENLPIFSRFGYLDESDQVTSFWIQSRLIDFIPRLSQRGMEITASTLIDVSDALVRARTKTYSGKISRVVEQIAADMDVDAEIEETNDDINEAHPDYEGAPKQWLINNMTLLDFVEKRLLPVAKSKSGQSNYIVWVSGGRTRTRKPVLHFHTKEFTDCISRRATKQFTYLLGAQDEVIDFQPSFSGSLLGNLGGGQVVMRNYDPITKQYTTKAQSILTNPNAVLIGEGTKTNAVPTTPEDPESDLEPQGVVMTREDDLDRALARSQNVHDVLRAASFNAQLDILGLPSTTDLESNDLIKVNVLIPNDPGSPGPPYRVHWSSGSYLVREALHHVGEGRYTIQCQLQREKLELGPEQAPRSELVAKVDTKALSTT